MNARVALVDCNNFYCSCERVFNPRLLGVPVVVLSNNDGCVIARSEEAKALGIKMGAPAFKSETLFRQHRVSVLSSNYALYGDMSARVMSVLQSEAWGVEIYSIDEAFLELGGAEDEAWARALRQKVRQWTGIPVSIGIASNKTLAKLANRIAKKSYRDVGVFVLPDDPDHLLAEVPCEDIWGIAAGFSRRLAGAGIRTALELKRAPQRVVRRLLGVVGERIALELGGATCLPLEEVPATRKGVASAKSFGRPVTELRELEEALATYVARCAEKIRAQNLLSARVQVFLSTNTFRSNQPQYHPFAQQALVSPTAHTPELIAAATELLRGIYRQGYEYRKTGIIMPDLVPASQAQMPLPFNGDESAARTAIDRLVDSINRRHGRDTITYGSMGTQRKWQMRQERRSPRWTTQWNELPEAKS